MSRIASFFLYYSLAVFFTVATRATHSPQRCNDYKPTCGLSASEARRKLLTSHADLRVKLEDLQASFSPTANTRFVAGPLIERSSSDHDGLFDIDVALPGSLPPTINRSPCATNSPSHSPLTIRQAVICTVSNTEISSVPRGNTNASRIGWSNHGRILLAARMGNPSGPRVAILTQIHGSEPATTEAVLVYLSAQVSSSGTSTSPLSKLDVLFILRINADAGEPSGTTDTPSDKPFNATTAFLRDNLDHTAGGGFVEPTEFDFLGIVGRGYNLARYLHANLQTAIRPVEAQAVVAALLSFRPHVLLDMHGDFPKAGCDLDASIVRMRKSGLPSVRCKPPAPEIPTLAFDREHVVIGAVFAMDYGVPTREASVGMNKEPEQDSWRVQTRMSRMFAGRLLKHLNENVPGQFTRFSQLLVGAGRVGVRGGSSLYAAKALGAMASGWEVLNFQTRMRVGVLAVLENGDKTTGLDLPDVDGCFLADNICVHRLALEKALEELGAMLPENDNIPEQEVGYEGDDGGLCDVPLASAVLSNFPSEQFGEDGTNGTEMVPIDGRMGVPIIILGRCPNDQAASHGSGSQVEKGEDGWTCGSSEGSLGGKCRV